MSIARKFTLALAAMLAGAVAAGSAARAQEIELSLGHVLAESSHYHAAAEKMAELVEARSDGRIKINIFPSGQLGGEVKMIQAARVGTQDLVVTGEAPVENTVKEFAVFSFPYLFTSVEQANSVLMGPIGRDMLDMLPAHDLIGLDFISALERNIFTNGKRVETAADMQGLKIRVIQGPGYVAAYEALGAQPTPMSYSELYMAMQNGAIDAAENSPDVFLQDRFAEVSKIYSRTRIMYMPALILMSKASFDRLSSEDQALIREASAEASTYATAHYLKDYAASFETMKSGNVEVVEPDLASFSATAPDVHDKLLASFPEAATWLERIKGETRKSD